MDWVAHTVSAFGHSVGISELALDADGCALFMLPPDGMLCLHDLHPRADEVLVILSRPLPAPAGPSLRRALLMADFRVNPGWQTQLAMRDADLVVTLRMPRHAFIMSALEDAVEALFDFHSRVTQAH